MLEVIGLVMEVGLENFEFDGNITCCMCITKVAGTSAE